jgi:hypothetical protein
MKKNIYFVNVNFIGNAGDYWSSPLKYYTFPEGYHYKHLHFIDVSNQLKEAVPNQETLIKNQLVILGGGGLVTTKGNYVNDTTEYLIKENKVITWAIGSNTMAPIDWQLYKHKNLILATSRDINWEADIEYLPCVSCKHPVFNKKHTSPSGIGIIEHPHYKIPISGDKISNNESIENIVDFISSKEYIITSTFHGFYWSQLLEKKVVVYVEPGKKINSKFLYSKHRPLVCDESNYLDVLENVSIPIGLLKESRKLNDNFYHRVCQEIKRIS